MFFSKKGLVNKRKRLTIAPMPSAYLRKTLNLNKGGKQEDVQEFFEKALANGDLIGSEWSVERKRGITYACGHISESREKWSFLSLPSRVETLYAGVEHKHDLTQACGGCKAVSECEEQTPAPETNRLFVRWAGVGTAQWSTTLFGAYRLRALVEYVGDGSRGHYTCLFPQERGRVDNEVVCVRANDWELCSVTRPYLQGGLRAPLAVAAIYEKSSVELQVSIPPHNENAKQKKKKAKYN